MSANLSVPVRQIIELLVAGEYEHVARITRGERLSAGAIEETIRDYGRTLIMPPDTAFEQLDVVRVKDAWPPCWSVRSALWTAEEQRSDLSIELTLTETKGGYVITLDDIHVL